jgi:hypothetical protein
MLNNTPVQAAAYDASAPRAFPPANRRIVDTRLAIVVSRLMAGVVVLGAVPRRGVQ